MRSLKSRRAVALASAGAAAALAAAGGIGAADAAVYSDPTMDLPRATGLLPGVGPRWPYVQQIQINTVIPLKNEAIINRTKYGYLYRAGQQNSQLTISVVDGRLRFADTGTQEWKWLPRACDRVAVGDGVAASCRIPTGLEAPMLLEVWPRLGNDVVDSTALSSDFDVSVLGDRGDDVVRFGAGDDFFNGAQDNDRAFGGDGRDWLRTGDGPDVIDGGDGGDHLVGVAGDDTIYGRGGDDRLGGDDGDDTIVSGEGTDFVVCGVGSDAAYVDAYDRAVGCESFR